MLKWDFRTDRFLNLGATCFRTEWRARANFRRLLLRDSPSSQPPGLPKFNFSTASPTLSGKVYQLLVQCTAKCRVHLESCTPGTRQYKVVRTGTYQYILFWIQGGTRKGKIVHTSTDESVLFNDMSIPVHTGMYSMYRKVQGGTRRYNQVQRGTQWY